MFFFVLFPLITFQSSPIFLYSFPAYRCPILFFLCHSTYSHVSSSTTQCCLPSGIVFLFNVVLLLSWFSASIWFLYIFPFFLSIFAHLWTIIVYFIAESLQLSLFCLFVFFFSVFIAQETIQRLINNCKSFNLQKKHMGTYSTHFFLRIVWFNHLENVRVRQRFVQISLRWFTMKGNETLMLYYYLIYNVHCTLKQVSNYGMIEVTLCKVYWWFHLKGQQQLQKWHANTLFLFTEFECPCSDNEITLMVIIAVLGVIIILLVAVIIWQQRKLSK